MYLEFSHSISSIPGPEWDHCAGPENPFVSHAFLVTLEESGCVGRDSGWIPHPALLRESPGGLLLAVCPCYIKLHSQGEYIFDYHWADAYHRLHPDDRSYYPKLQVAVPFTPVPGPRILVNPELPPERQQPVRKAVLRGLREACARLDYSSVHMTFCREEECRAALQAGYLERLGEQYHWFNEGYEDFEDFLSRLTSRKRKTIRKERRRANSHGLKIRTVHGHELRPAECLAFFRMYEATSLQKWGRPYLNLPFFQILARRLKEKMVLFLVERPEDGRLVAGAWNLRGAGTLFGRNWGCLEYYDLLHFEVCYYRAIDYAILHGLGKVEAGAQGMHKIQRGYRPQPVHSAHHIESVPFRQAIARYLRAEREETEFRLDALTDLEPFKSQNSAPRL